MDADERATRRQSRGMVQTWLLGLPLSSSTGQSGILPVLLILGQMDLFFWTRSFEKCMIMMLMMHS